MAVDGRRAYLAAWGYGLIVVDLSNPTSPRELGRLPAEFSSAIAGKGRHVYLGTATEWRVGDVRRRVESGSSGGAGRGSGGHPGRAAATGRTVSVRGHARRTSREGLRAACASSMSATPRRSARSGATPTIATSPATWPSAAMPGPSICDARAASHIVDVSQPSRPVRVGFYAASQGGRAIALGSGSVFVATDGDCRGGRCPQSAPADPAEPISASGGGPPAAGDARPSPVRVHRDGRPADHQAADGPREKGVGMIGPGAGSTQGRSIEDQARQNGLRISSSTSLWLRPTSART